MGFSEQEYVDLGARFATQRMIEQAKGRLYILLKQLARAPDASRSPATRPQWPSSTSISSTAKASEKKKNSPFKRDLGFDDKIPLTPFSRGKLNGQGHRNLGQGDRDRRARS
jgi:hypothetical protein